jgi:hypothetical protein
MIQIKSPDLPLGYEITVAFGQASDPKPARARVVGGRNGGVVEG